MIPFPVIKLRSQFPALGRRLYGREVVFFDGPGGTQVPRRVIDAVTDYYMHHNANVGGTFTNSHETDEIVQTARQSMAALLNAPEPECIVFGQNMTTLTFHLSASIAETIRPGDEVIVTDLDHDANVAPWLALAARGAVIRTVPVNTADCTLDVGRLTSLLSDRTRLVAITAASNAVGTMPDIKAMIAASHNVGALTFIDAVQFVPHCLTDVQALDCDFLACSAYKFFGPHQGVLYGKRNVLQMFQPRKVRPAKNILPYSWETGTQCHELLAGVTAAVDYLAAISDDAKEPGTRADLRSRLVASFHDIREWEQQLSAKVLATLGTINGLQLYGLTDSNHLHLRVPTFAFTVQGFTPREVAGHLAARSVYCWSGNYYAVRLMEALGLEEAGGAVRIGLEHLNTFEEIDYMAECLTDLKQ